MLAAMPRAVLLLFVFAVAAGAFWLLMDDVPPGAGPRALEFPDPLATDEPPTNDPWTDPDWLVPHFERACRAVEYVCGEPFKTRPTLRIGTGIELSDLYRLSAIEFAKRKGREMPPDLPGNEALFAEYAKYQFGRYFAEEHAITVSKDAIEHYRDSLRRTLHGGDGVKLVLVHELTHAWQHERFKRMWLEFMFQPDKEAAGCAWAMIEGHAQHVTKQVAERWGMERQFRDLRAYFEGADEGWDREDQLESESWRNYVAGQDFIDAVYAEGGRARVLEALEHPPRRRRELFDPQRWLRRRAARDNG